MAGETAVEQPTAAPATTEPVNEEKKEIAEAEAKEAEAGEKKDEEKETSKPADKADKTDKAKAKKLPFKKDFEKDVAYMYQYNRMPALPSMSPSCLKLETWIKLCGIKYENVDPKIKCRSSKGQIPFVEYNGDELNDCDNIIKELGNKNEMDLDKDIEQENIGIQHAMLTMLDNHLHWCITHWYTRDLDNAVKGYKINLQHMFNSKVPTPVLTFMVKHTFFRKTIRKMKNAGFGNYSDDEMDTMGKTDLKTLSDLLGNKQYFFGDELRMLDLSAFVWLAMIINVDKEVACPLRDYTEEECQNLVGLYNRIKERAWGDHWDEATGDKLEMNPHIPKPEPEPEPVKEEEKKEEEKKDDEEKKEEEKEKAEEKKDDDKEEKEADKEEEKDKDNKDDEEKK